MVIKWKKSKLNKKIVIYVVMFLVVLLNIIPIVYGCSADFWTYEDYQQIDEFTMIAKKQFNQLSWMTDYNQKKLQNDTNLLYKVHVDGIDYSNSDALYYNNETQMIQAPKGYNYLIYYDGQTINVYKDGTKISSTFTATWNKRSCVIMMAYAKAPKAIEGSMAYDLYEDAHKVYNQSVQKLTIMIVLAVLVDVICGFRKINAPWAIKVCKWCSKTWMEISRIFKKIKDAAVSFYKKHSYKYRMKIQLEKTMKEQMEAERMKLELITNVSHDLKTPLTSIINYVQLLKNEEMSEDAKTYVQIIDQKSERLRNMVLDVFAISKAAAGQLEVDMQQLDFGKLIAQTVADMDQEIQESTVAFKLDMPQEPVEIITDGNRMFRVFQNLIDNALKYSLAYSRVYISLNCHGNQAVASIKNVSRDELNSKVDYTDRFVRGDQNRSEPGSGLGLAIAKSFTEYCGGTFDISADADLFCANVTFPIVEKQEEEVTVEMPAELKVIIEESRA